MFESAIFILGFVINATIIASASSLLSNMDIQAMEKKNHLDRINDYMRSSNVNSALQNKIRGYYHFVWDIGMAEYSQRILKELPPKLHLQLNLTLKKHLVEKCPLFKTCTPAAVIAIVQNLHPLVVLPNDLVVKAGEVADCMYFINRGSVSIFIPAKDQDQNDCVEYLVTLRKGAFFGEVGILDPTSKRTANVLSENYCELQVLHANDFQVLLRNFPEFEEAIQYLASKRITATKNAQAKTLKTRRNSISGGSRPPSFSFGSTADSNGKSPMRFGGLTRTQTNTKRRFSLSDAPPSSSESKDSAASTGKRRNSFRRAAKMVTLVNRMSTLGMDKKNDKGVDGRSFYEDVMNAENNLSYGMARDFSHGMGIQARYINEAKEVSEIVQKTHDKANLNKFESLRDD